MQPKGHKRKRSSAPQRADPADLYPNDAPSPRQAPPLLAFSTAWRHASSSPEPEPAPEMTPAGTPSPRRVPAPLHDVEGKGGLVQLNAGNAWDCAAWLGHRSGCSMFSLVPVCM